ncbi:MAG: response regulator, partial [Acidobacteria bacterium]|nr:response regulator [Acidobacteriota bacterium]
MTVTSTFTVLVVDENQAVRQFVDLAVGSDVVRVVGVADGHAALDSVERMPPDLVLAATGLTGLGGHDLAARLSSRNLPVVLVTGSLDRTGADAGAAVGVLAKPLGVQQLRDLVSRMVTDRPDVHASSERQEEPAVEVPAEIDAIDAWLSDADSTLGLAPERSLATEPGVLSAFA